MKGSDVWISVRTVHFHLRDQLRIDTERIEDKRMREMIELSSVSIITSLALPFVISRTKVMVQQYNSLILYKSVLSLALHCLRLTCCDEDLFLINGI